MSEIRCPAGSNYWRLRPVTMHSRLVGLGGNCEIGHYWDMNRIDGRGLASRGHDGVDAIGGK
jgi:hypothetical protein